MESFWKNLKLQSPQGLKTSISLLISCEASSKNASALTQKNSNWDQKISRGSRTWQVVHCFVWSSEDKRILSARFSTGTLTLDPSDFLGDLWMIVVRKKNYLFLWKQKEGSHLKTGYGNNRSIDPCKGGVQNHPTKELISFVKEEMEKSRQCELKLFHHWMLLTGNPFAWLFSRTRCALVLGLKRF